MALKDWINFPLDTYGEWGLRANQWLNDLLDQVNINVTDITYLNASTDTITLATNIINFGGAYRDAYCQLAGNVVHLGGLVQNNTGGNVGSTATILTLPAGFRPIGGAVLVPVATTAGYSRATIGTSGALTPGITWANAETLSLEGISFVLDI